TALAGQVSLNEPGNKLYQPVKPREDAGTDAVMWVFQDEAARDAHGKTEYFKAAGPKIAPTMAGRPEILYFDSVCGVRAGRTAGASERVRRSCHTRFAVVTERRAAW